MNVQGWLLCRSQKIPASEDSEVILSKSRMTFEF
jgi:hypothetical protein